MEAFSSASGDGTPSSLLSPASWRSCANKESLPALFGEHLFDSELNCRFWYIHSLDTYNTTAAAATAFRAEGEDLGFLACSFAWSGSGCRCSGAGGCHGLPSLWPSHSVCMAAYSGDAWRGYLTNVSGKVGNVSGKVGNINFLPLLEQISHPSPVQTTQLCAMHP